MIKTKNILIISSNRLGDAILSSGLNAYFTKSENSKNLLLSAVQYHQNYLDIVKI